MRPVSFTVILSDAAEFAGRPGVRLVRPGARVEIADSGATVVAQLIRRYPWDRLTLYGVGATSVGLLTWGTRRRLIPVPRRAFPNAAAWDEFYGLAMRLHPEPNPKDPNSSR